MRPAGRSSRGGPHTGEPWQLTQDSDRNLTNPASEGGGKNVYSVGKWDIGNGQKRVLAKFEATQSLVRGVNDYRKFAKIRKKYQHFKPSPPSKNSDLFLRFFFEISSLRGLL